MEIYLDLIKQVFDTGVHQKDRTGCGTLSLFGYQMRFDLRKGFPLVTTKKCHFHSIVHELLWFLKGDTNIQYLKENKVRIWNEWANDKGDLGPIYGKQWRNWEGPEGQRVDQISEVIEQIKTNPTSRRLVVVAYNPGEIHKMALPPCHAFFQFYVNVQEGTLSCQMYQRSADLFLGLPFNIASYSLLTHMIAHVTGLKAGEFVHTLGDAHLYLNHLEQARLQSHRKPRPLPQLKLSPEVKDLFQFKYEDIQLTDYHPHPAIPAAVSI